MGKYVLGIDTSNYTTSIAVVDENAKLICDERKLLVVKDGERGLRQSDALFQHINNIPGLFEKISNLPVGRELSCISVSSRPRPVSDSYMPVFLGGQSAGKTLAHTLNCSYCEYSHQENHVEAAKWSNGIELGDEFIGIHLSGGTTEILHIVNNQEDGYKIKIIGATSDISAGQFIDRVGVNLGFSFPAGRELDKLAQNGPNEKLKLSFSLKDGYMSFSGPETMAQKYIKQNLEHSLIAEAVFDCISRALRKAIIYCCNQTKLSQVLIMGGVGSSEYLRRDLMNNLPNEGISLYFGDPKYCTDNAVGTALLGLKYMKGGRRTHE